MSALFKILLFTSPILALVFYYVVSQQAKIDTEMKREDAGFERAWNEFEADFAKTPEQRAKYEERARQADAELQEFKKKEEERRKKAEEFEREFEKAMKEFETEKQKGEKK